jgi:hypothetical protein
MFYSEPDESKQGNQGSQQQNITANTEESN